MQVMEKMQRIQTMNALQQGLIWGAILGVFNLIISLISPFTDTFLFSGFLFSSLVFTIHIIVYVFVGLRASRVTGRAGTGAFVGFLTGLFSYIIGLIGTIITTFTDANEMHQKLQDLANQSHLSGNAMPLLLLLVFTMVIIGGFILSPGLGALCGAIGGAIGKRQAKSEGLPELESH